MSTVQMHLHDEIEKKPYIRKVIMKETEENEDTCSSRKGMVAKDKKFAHLKLAHYFGHVHCIDALALYLADGRTPPVSVDQADHIPRQPIPPCTSHVAEDILLAPICFRL
jgi:hypothetical protein